MKLKHNRNNLLFLSHSLITLTLFFSCSQSNNSNQPKQKVNHLEELAKKVVTDFLRDTLAHSDSLYIRKFSQLDSSFTNLLDDRDYVELALTSKSLLDSFDKAYDKMKNSNQVYKNATLNSDTLYLKKYLLKIDSVNNIMTQISDSFKKMFNGWTISNQFEVKNVFNGITVVNGTYFLDSTVSKVVRFIDDYSEGQKVKDFKHSYLQFEFFKRHVDYSSVLH